MDTLLLWRVSHGQPWPDEEPGFWICPRCGRNLKNEWLVLWFHIAAMFEVVAGISGADRAQRRGPEKCLQRPGLGFTGEVLHLEKAASMGIMPGE